MKTHLIVAGLLGSTLLASGAMAQTPPAPAANPPTQASNSSEFMTRLNPGTMLVSDLMDEDVVGPDGKEIGEVENVVLDRNGKVVALVIEVEEGFGDRTVALPMSAFRMNADAVTTGSVQGSGQAVGTPAARDDDDMQLVLGIPVDQLKSAPEFDDD